MSAQTQADEALRAALLDWLRVHDRAHDGEIPGDLLAVAHFRTWTDDESQIDDYEVIVPAGVSYHSVLGLIAQAADMHAAGDDDA